MNKTIISFSNYVDIIINKYRTTSKILDLIEEYGIDGRPVSDHDASFLECVICQVAESKEWDVRESHISKLHGIGDPEYTKKLRNMEHELKVKYRPWEL